MFVKNLIVQIVKFVKGVRFLLKISEIKTRFAVIPDITPEQIERRKKNPP